MSLHLSPIQSHPHQDLLKNFSYQSQLHHYLILLQITFIKKIVLLNSSKSILQFLIRFFLFPFFFLQLPFQISLEDYIQKEKLCLGLTVSYFQLCAFSLLYTNAKIFLILLRSQQPVQLGRLWLNHYFRLLVNIL